MNTYNKIHQIYGYTSFQFFYIIQGYFDGIVGNLMLVPIYYPGWVMRLYYDLEDRDPITKVRFERINIDEFMYNTY